MKNLLLIAFLVTAGCSSRPPAPEVSPVTDIPTRGGWYCQPGFTPGAWDCVQDPQLAESPPPPRPIPSPPASVAAPEPGGPAAPADPDPAADPFEALGEPPAPEAAPAAPTAARAPEPVATGTLEALPSGHYTIQLAAMFRHADLAPLLARDDVGDAFVAEVELDGTLYHALLTGVYDSEAAALAAIERLPDDLRALEPWVRPVGSLQQANARAQRLVAESAGAKAATP